MLKLKVGDNWCTPKAKIHPNHEGMLILHANTYFVQSALIYLDKRQVWTVYYYQPNPSGWCCERENVSFNLSEEGFRYYFGDAEIEKRYVEQ